MAKKCTEKRDAREMFFFLLNKPITFLMFSLPSPSSLLNPPNILEPGTGCLSPCALYCKRTKYKTKHSRSSQ